MAAFIRPYETGDEEAINRVIKSVFDEYNWKWDPQSENQDTHDIVTHYLDRKGYFWVLVEADEVIGSVAIREIDGKRCSLNRLYLSSPNRGQGYGRKLYHFAIDQALSLGYEEMEIWSDKTLDVSHLMYKNSGAKSLGDRTVSDPDYGYPYDEWGYLLDLKWFAATRSNQDEKSA